MKNKKLLVAGVGLVLIIVAVVVIIINSPASKTARDLQTVTNFDAIQKDVANYYKANNKLPTSLSELNSSSVLGAYDYQSQDGTIFKLCANFEADVSEEIIDKAPIRVNYKQGNDCVTFNIGDQVNTDLKPTIVKKEADLVKVNKSISKSSDGGITAGSITINFDTTKSYFYKNNSDGNYFLNLFTTIGTNKECNSSLNPATGCCYTLSDTTLTSGSNSASYNRLGLDTYINPFPKNATDTYGDLPPNFCFNGGKEFSGGVSFIIPKEMVNSDGSAKMTLKHTNNGETSGDMTIEIK